MRGAGGGTKPAARASGQLCGRGVTGVAKTSGVGGANEQLTIGLERLFLGVIG